MAAQQDNPAPELMGGRQEGVFDALSQLQMLLSNIKKEDIDKIKAIIAAIDHNKISDLLKAIRVFGDTIQIDLRLILPKI